VTMTDTRYTGECIRGPYTGKMLVNYSKQKPVLIRDGALVREGAYEFMDGVWIWDGPRVVTPTNQGGGK
jgi:hypothetical protein